MSWGLLLFVLAAGPLVGCQSRLDELPMYSAERHVLQVVIETPAGTSRPMHYDAASGEFRPEQRAGADVQVPFLPYPANAGFVPGTRQADGRALQALVLCETQPAGTVLEVLPIGLLLLDHGGDMQNVVLTVPARPSQRVLPVTSWRELTRQYPAAREVLRLWYQHSTDDGSVRVAGWRDEQAAETLLKQARRPE